ncbi:MAG TPA: 16S rRNA (guanine(527)-N(7))-methyltransferase RsmG [Chloroflexi bacterium]|mgnify:CR=1 FL=1|nr:16S rRNA (guanine(527)-N(7))-methyltransferase RsmG [Chloroflexota bacterium]
MESLIVGARDLNIRLTDEHLAAFEICYRELMDWNERFNLTAITDHEGVLIRHFLDSLSCLKVLPRGRLADGARMIDVGAGAGFPGIPLKIVCPKIRLTLLEATHKKVVFLKHVVDVLGLQNVEIIHERAETLGQDLTHREQYDFVLARAVADMPTLVEYLLPLAQIGGMALAQKGHAAAAEAQRAEVAIETLGGRLRQLAPVELRGLAETRYLVVMDKIASTPEKYPRRPGMPQKRPIVA